LLCKRIEEFVRIGQETSTEYGFSAGQIKGMFDEFRNGIFIEIIKDRKKFGTREIPGIA
jgi:hypothetical protein